MEPSSADAVCSVLLESIRKTDQVLWKLDVLLKTVTETQLPSKQPLLLAVESAKKILDKVQLGKPSGTEARFIAVRGRNGSTNPVTSFRQASMQALQVTKDRLHQIRNAAKVEQATPGTKQQHDLQTWNAVVEAALKDLSRAVAAYESSNMELRSFFSLTVKVVEAQGLLSVDGEQADSYVEVFVDRQKKAKTRTIAATKNPSYAQEFYFYVPSDAASVTFNVMDEVEGASQDNWIGQVTIPVEKVQQSSVDQTWFPLEGMPIGRVGGRAKLHYAASIRKGQLQVQVFEASRLLDGDEVVSSLVRVDIINTEGEGDQNKAKRTEVAKKQLSPKWNTTLSFSDSEFDPKLHFLRLAVYECHKGKQKFLGKTEIAISSIVSAPVDKWARLELKTTKGRSQGSLRLSIKFREEKVLSDAAYEELAALLTADDMTVPALLARVATNVPEKKEIFRSVVAVFICKDKLSWVLSKLLQDEVDNTWDVTTLFRGNSTATICTDVYLHTFCKEWLRDVLHAPIQDIIAMASKQSFELDPDRDEDNTKFDGAKNLQALLDHLSHVWESIYASIDTAPRQLREIMKNMRNRTMAKWPDAKVSGNVKYTCVTSFLFLRFFCAAILGPHLFGVVDDTPSPAATRNLMIAAKVLMNLGNLIMFGQKEQYFEPVNKWLSTNIPMLVDFVERLTTVPPEKTAAIIPFVPFGKEMSHIHRYLESKMSQIQEEIEVNTLATGLSQADAATVATAISKSERPVAIGRKTSALNMTPLIPRKGSGSELKLSKETSSTPDPAESSRPRSNSAAMRKQARDTTWNMMKELECISPSDSLRTREVQRYVESLVKLKKTVQSVSAIVEDMKQSS